MWKIRIMTGKKKEYILVRKLMIILELENFIFDYNFWVFNLSNLYLSDKFSFYGIGFNYSLFVDC